MQQAENQTEIVLSAGGNTDRPVTSNMLDALVRVMSPATAPHVLYGRIVTLTTGALGTLTVEDPDGDIYDLLTLGTDPVVAVFDHHDDDISTGQVHTAGLWTGNPKLCKQRNHLHHRDQRHADPYRGLEPATR